jgi:hypothetical protein
MDGDKRLTNAVLREYSILAIRNFDKPEPIVFPAILKKFEEDAPTLFSEKEMR